MITGYRVLPNTYFGGARQFNKNWLPQGFVFDAPPAVGPGEYVRFIGGQWRVTTVAPFDPVPGDNIPDPPVLSPKQFWQRFTVAEREALQSLIATGTQAVKNKLNAFREYIRDVGEVNCGDAYIVAALTQMENAGVIGPGRAAEILAP